MSSTNAELVAPTHSHGPDMETGYLVDKNSTDVDIRSELSVSRGYMYCQGGRRH
jgi:hypothetical protein